MSLITGIRMCYVPASDIPAVRNFYEDTLGLGVKFADGDHWIQYGLAGCDFAVAGPRETPRSASGPVVVFDVPDLAPLLARLEAAGVEAHLRDMGDHGSVLTVQDPSGHAVQFFSRNK